MAFLTGVWQGKCRRSLLQSAHWAREEECAFCQLHDMHCGDVVLEPLYLNNQWKVAVIWWNPSGQFSMGHSFHSLHRIGYTNHSSLLDMS
jgi:hypothetical protein